MRRRLRWWLALLLVTPLWPGCGGESEDGRTVERGEFPPVEETPPPEAPEAAAAPSPEAPLAGEIPPAGETPPVGESAPAAPPTPAVPPGAAEVPWPEGGALVEVVPLGDPAEQSNEVVKNVFEVRALPEDALAEYQAVLARSGWQTEFMGTDTVVAYKEATMLLVSPAPASGKTLLEVIVSPRPDERGTGVQ